MNNTPTKQNNEKWNITKLQIKEEQEKYMQKIEEKLEQHIEEIDIEDIWSTLELTITKAADKTIAKNKTNRTKPCTRQMRIEKNILNAVEKRRQLIRRQKGEKEHQKYEMMERSRPRPGSREFYNLISNERKRTVLIPNPDENGNTIVSEEKPSYAEVQRAINKLKNCKAPGSDNIPSELFKYGGNSLHQEMHKLIMRKWREEKLPTKWQDSIRVHEKRDKSKCVNYRGISLRNTAYKVMENALLEKLTLFAENTLGEYQAGFRRERSTIDFRQAYDSVERNGRTFNPKETHSDDKSVHGRWEMPLSALLFNIVLETAIRREDIKTELLSTEGPKLILAYADDIDLIGNTILRVKEIFNKIEGTTSEMGLMINEENTKYMCVNRLGRRDRIGQNVSINTYNFERVERFKYLGATITVDNITE
uniref:Reverse transcriptase domain-containing protein n=1 Tax=Dendroctonus ponderosae TaxID=77166 RepID=A0AAR5PYV5_DENPD